MYMYMYMYMYICVCVGVWWCAASEAEGGCVCGCVVVCSHRGRGRRDTARESALVPVPQSHPESAVMNGLSLPGSEATYRGHLPRALTEATYRGGGERTKRKKASRVAAGGFEPATPRPVAARAHLTSPEELLALLPPLGI